jgi:hypothetical protein
MFLCLDKGVHFITCIYGQTVTPPSPKYPLYELNGAKDNLYGKNYKAGAVISAEV